MSASPRKEIRFTRNAQALHFFIAALVFLCLGAALWLLSLDFWSDLRDPVLDHWWYALLPLPFALALAAAGIHLARHAYMIFSPVGIELFPFFFPSRNMEVFYWSEVQEAGFTPDRKMMVITLIGEPERKVFIATAPLSRESRVLLEHAVAGMQARRAEGDDSTSKTKGDVAGD